MPVMMVMNWSGVKPEQYDQLRKTVRWETDYPDGAKFHCAAFGDNGIHVTDLWDSADNFNKFVETRLMPEVQKLGITNQPEVNIYPLHATFNPGIDKL